MNRAPQMLRVTYVRHNGPLVEARVVPPNVLLGFLAGCLGLDASHGIVP